MVESKWFSSKDTIEPEIIERNGVSVAIRGVHECNVFADISVPKHKVFDDYMYDAVRVFANDTKSAMLREAKAKAVKYKDEYQDIRIVPMTIKGTDVVVMYARDIEKSRKSPKYTVREVKSKYSKL